MTVTDCQSHNVKITVMSECRAKVNCRIRNGILTLEKRKRFSDRATWVCCAWPKGSNFFTHLEVPNSDSNDTLVALCYQNTEVIRRWLTITEERPSDVQMSIPFYVTALSHKGNVTDSLTRNLAVTLDRKRTKLFSHLNVPYSHSICITGLNQ